MTNLKAGDKAPNFKARDQDDNVHQLSNYKGKKLALYFYPRDSTPTCTVEACNLRDNFSLLNEKGITILGVSADDVKSHAKFSAKHNLPFPILADTDHKLLNAYGVWGPKKFMGKEFDGIHRTTFLIDEKGKIAEVITKVVAKNHAQQILEAWNLI